MNKPHYSFISLHPYHLDTAMRHYFPKYLPLGHGMDDADYISIRKALEQIRGTFPTTSMQTIERYCEEALPYVAQVANDCKIAPNTTTHGQLLNVIIYATIRADYCEEWESRITDEHLLDMAETLRVTIEDNIPIEYHEDGWEEAGQQEMDDMNDTDRTWQIANGLG